MEPNLDSDLLRTFVAIAETGSFTSAADSVSRTQSAVSMQMKRLEDVVGERLFVREARGVSLTGPGDRLLMDSRRIIALLDQTKSALRGEQLNGLVRVGLPDEYGLTMLPNVLGKFATSHPDVDVTVRCGNSDELNDALNAGDLDLAVLFEEQVRPDSEILTADPTVWATSRIYCMHELDPVPVAVYELDCWCRDWALKSLEQQGVNYRIAFTSDNHEGLQSAVRAGLAIAPLSRSNIPEDCRELTKDDGYWNFLTSNVVLRYRPRLMSAVADSMSMAIREAFADS
ncbi:MAG: LysR family transcriptional regulator [Rhizobiales bacterium]|nr:LysR family transcriptional regulator [Hyphomicrobiales bacterium]